MAAEVPPGHRLFARYAHAPNALGYCGPAGSVALGRVACGENADVDVPAVARGFSGAWPYQQVLAELTGVRNPLAEEVVRGYWTGNDLTEQVDRVEFGRMLIDRIKPQAGGYWSHLDDALLAEAAPTHAFHVLAVYPWSRLLATGRPEPLTVLDSCRVGWASVVAVGREQLVVRTRHLAYADHALVLGDEQEEHVDYRLEGAPFVDGLAVGDRVAVHWGFACDRLDDAQVTSLERWTTWQLQAMAPRLAASSSG